ncbi:arsenate reductase [Chitinivorax tropicus]|uniref:Arsenate reductase n=1 Tax=Chitinivorax tropicus TaxID=714531 RepID=A0A840ML17_9PROT|nr:ArsC family reductase [Chitinivorax tropicus]MBB5017567.1 arsenate reductase [Chitinivorax tropicus]
MKIYGIPNCNTVKKAREWLISNQIDIPFHDFKKSGVDETLLNDWLKQVSWEKLVNRQGTTWRQLSDEDKAAIVDNASAIQLMLAKSSVIKRPVLEVDGKVYLGFDEAIYQQVFNK